MCLQPAEFLAVQIIVISHLLGFNGSVHTHAANRFNEALPLAHVFLTIDKLQHMLGDVSADICCYRVILPGLLRVHDGAQRVIHAVVAVAFIDIQSLPLGVRKLGKAGY